MTDHMCEVQNARQREEQRRVIPIMVRIERKGSCHVNSKDHKLSWRRFDLRTTIPAMNLVAIVMQGPNLASVKISGYSVEHVSDHARFSSCYHA